MPPTSSPTAPPKAPPAAPPTQRQIDTAVAHHREGRLDAAISGYEVILAADPRQSALRHNLGLLRLGQGQLAVALRLLDQAFAEDGEHAGWLQSLPTIGLTLVQHGAWEDALPWLERGALRLPGHAELQQALARARPRNYLAPEVFDPVQQRSLLRHAPREAASYVYAIDVVGTCNLRCPTCPVGNFAAAERPKGFMALAMFEQILAKIVAEQVCERPEIWLFNWGEPLLHPELPALIAAVKRLGLPCHLSSNLNIEHGLRGVVKANPDNLKISLSGFTPESYAITHARGDLLLVKANMYLLRHWLDHYQSSTRVWVGHHIYKGNEGQVEAVRALCQELRFEHHPIGAFFQPMERLMAVLDGSAPPQPILERLVQHPREYVSRIRATRSERHDCELRFNQTVINHDGSVALCCSVYDKPNMLGLDFLATPHAELEQAKYGHPFCRKCMASGVSYSVRDARR